MSNESDIKWSVDSTVVQAAGSGPEIHQTTDRALWHGEDLYRTILETAMDGFVIVDMEGRLLEVNRAYCRMSGYERSELLRMTIAGLEAEETAEQIAEHLRRIAATGEDRFESRHRRRDGTVFDVEISVQYRPGESPTCVAFFRDVTSRKEIEAALARHRQNLASLVDERTAELAASERRWKFALEAMTDAVVITDTGGRLLEFNTAFATFHKFKSKSEIALDLLEWPKIIAAYSLEGEALPFDQWVVPRALGGEANPRAEYRLRRLDTGEEWIGSISAAPIRDRSGAVIGAVTVARDVTDAKRMEQALRIHGAHQRLLLRIGDTLRGLSSPDEMFSKVARLVGEHVGADRVGFAVDAGDGVHVDVRATFTRVPGGLRDQYRYEDFGLERFRKFRAGLMVVRPDVRNDPTLTEAEKKAHAAMQIAAVVNAPLSSTGKCKAVLFVHSRAPRVWTGDELALFGEVASRTWVEVERVRAERGLEALTMELRAARDSAEAANAAKTTFLANMSHELRTPLNAIMGMGELARSQSSSPEIRKWLDILMESSRDLLALINDLLDLSVIEAQKVKLLETDFELGRLLERIVRTQHQAAASKGLLLGVELEPGLGGLRWRGDHRRLGQILLNLVKNAIRHTDKGSVTVRAESAGIEPSGVVLRFEVEDTGVGVPPEHRERIFMPFEQAGPSSARNRGGSGLGLAICRLLVGAMGGEIGVAEGVSGGARFWFTVRLGRTPVLPSAESSSPVDSAADVLRRDYHGTRVLLAEDDPVNREIAVMFLERVGFSVDVVCDGLEALEKATANSYRIVLMDVRMPRMDGTDAARGIRQACPVDGPVIIAMTANVFAGDRDKCKAAGMDEFIGKPVDIEELYSKILRFLKTP